MPILKPGQVIDGQDKAPELYGVKPQTNSMMFRERLLKLFRPQDWVEFKNIDDEPIFWQCVPEDSETVSFDATGSMKEVHRKLPEQWYVLPGTTEPIPGYAAQVGFDVLYKTVAAKSTLHHYKDPNDPRKMKDGSYGEKSFNFSDATIQEDTIKKAFLGVIAPTFGGAPVASIQAPVSEPALPAETEARAWPTPADPTEQADKPATKAKANVSASR